MIFPPLIITIMLIFFALAVVLFPLLVLQVFGAAFEKLGISRPLVFWLLILTLLGSLVNIPITTLEGRKVVTEKVISYYGMRVWMPRAPLRQYTVLAVNVGGAVIPALLSLLLAYKIGFSLRLLVLLGAVTLIMNRVARPIQGLGIAVPGLVAPLATVLGAWLLYPETLSDLKAPSVYIASTMGTLIGADLLRLKDIPQLGAPVASIGGAGTFDAIFLSGVIAVLLS